MTVCANEHPSVVFLSKECPVCRMLKSNEEEENNTEFYRLIVDQIGDLFGEPARTADDGTVHDSVLALKVYPLVARMFHTSNPNPRKRRMHARIHINPRRRSGTGPAVLLGVAIGYIGALFGRKDK